MANPINNSDVTTLEMDNILRSKALDNILPSPQMNMLKNKIMVELNTGLVSETPLIVDNNLVNIKNLYLSGNNMFQTYACDSDFTVINSHITSIPQEIFVNEIVEIGFNNGLHIECTPNAGISCVDGGFKRAIDFKLGDGANGAFFDINIMQPKPRTYYVTHHKKKIKAIAQPVFYFFCEHQNVLLPYFDDEKGELSFICIHQ